MIFYISQVNNSIWHQCFNRYRSYYRKDGTCGNTDAKKKGCSIIIPSILLDKSEYEYNHSNTQIIYTCKDPVYYFDFNELNGKLKVVEIEYETETDLICQTGNSPPRF